MNEPMEWADYLKFGVVQVIVTFCAAYFASYIREKGKNLATREDIQKITDKVESVKVVYAKELEVLKAEYSAHLKYFESQLSRKLHVDGTRFEKEFQVIQSVWTALIDFQRAANHLRYVINLPIPKPGMKEEAYGKFREARETLDSTLGKNSPFVAKEVYIAVADLMKSRQVMELCFYKPESASPPDAPINRDAELEAINQDTNQITQQVLKIGAVIRQRIEE
jgi:hypothetical protein